MYQNQNLDIAGVVAAVTAAVIGAVIAAAVIGAVIAGVVAVVVVAVVAVAAIDDVKFVYNPIEKFLINSNIELPLGIFSTNICTLFAKRVCN